MAKYAISQEGADAMNSLANSLLIEANAVIEASQKLEQQTASLADGLGTYEEDIVRIIHANRATLQQNRESIITLSRAIKQKADDIKSLLSLDIGQESGGAGTFGVSSNGGTSHSKLTPNRSTPRDLACSQFGFAKDTDGNLVYDSPNEMNQYLYGQQGSADPLFQGTCGLCSCANILRLAGVNATEAEMISYASNTKSSNSLFGNLCQTGYSDPRMNGGTSPKDRQEILSHFGIDSGIFQLTHNDDGSISDDSITQIADRVSEGRGVILSVHADILWHDAPVGVDDYHAITVTSVKKDQNGNALGFYVCDSAMGGTSYYPAAKIQRALTGAPMNVTYSIIR